MKIHYGLGALIAFGLFAAVVLVMVFVSLSQRVDLVAEDYYQQELRHESRLESQRRVARLTERPAVSVEHSTVTVVFPGELASGGLAGSLLFYRPDDRDRDFAVALRLDSSGTQKVALPSAKPGLWRLKASWTFASEEYYFEEPFFLQ